MPSRPCVLVLAGLDPGGGAGLLADARAITAAGAFACGVATILTTQSTCGLRRWEPVRPALWTSQASVVLGDQDVRAIKVGALGRTSNVRALGAFLAAHRAIPAVVDPVLVPTRGTGRLLEERAIDALRTEVVARATLVTANATEAEALTCARVTNLEEARVAAHAIVTMGARAALIKGGHLTGARAIDVLALHGARKLTELGATRLELPKKIHGAGCTLSALIAGRLAVGDGLVDAVRWAKRVHHRALARAIDVGGDLAVLSVDA
jgi:hydroxymethylpyrimidine/phosphomethylpyrimidine kinase